MKQENLSPCLVFYFLNSSRIIIPRASRKMHSRPPTRWLEDEIEWEREREGEWWKVVDWEDKDGVCIMNEVRACVCWLQHEFISSSSKPLSFSLAPAFDVIVVNLYSYVWLKKSRHPEKRFLVKWTEQWEKDKYSVDIRLCVTIDVDSKYYDKGEKESEKRRFLNNYLMRVCLCVYIVDDRQAKNGWGKEEKEK